MIHLYPLFHLWKKRFFSWACLFLYLGNTLQAQDIHFSQFFETPLLRNPALAGIFSGDVRFQAVYRTQWNSVTVPYLTGSFNGERKYPIGPKDDFVTVGGQILYDRAGTIAMTSTHLLPVLNYHKSLRADKNMYLSMGLMGGWVQRRIDRSRITTNSQFDGTVFNPGLADGEGNLKNSYNYLDAGVGMSFNSQVGGLEDNNIFLGLALHHLNKASHVSFYSAGNEMAPKWVGSAGFRFAVNDAGYLTFQADHSRQSTYRETIGGVFYTWKLGDYSEPVYLFHLGALLRYKDAFIPVAKIQKNPLSVAVSYDFNISSLKTASQGRGGFEVSLVYQTFQEKKKSSHDVLLCPRF